MLVCKNHPFIEVSYREDRCSCKVVKQQQTCNFCNNVEQIINCNAMRVCIDKMPKPFIQAVPLKTYLHDKLLPCKCSFNVGCNKVYCKI